MRLLIVDDAKDYLSSLVRVLKNEYSILTADSLEDAKQKMDGTIRLALLDVRLSERDSANRDGLLLLGWIKENFPGVPVVMMSAYRDFDAAADALNIGADRFLRKPINLLELRAALSELVK